MENAPVVTEKKRKLAMSPAWVEALKPEAKPAEYRDAETRGLVLRVEPSGRKTWVCRYVFEGAEQRFTIGTFPETSLSVARKTAEKTRGKAHAGVNEQAARRALRVGETVEDVSKSWLKSEDTRHWRPRSRSGFEMYLRTRILPDLGPVKVARVSRAMVQGLLDNIEALHTRNRVLEVLRMLFNWSVGRALIPSSPCEGVKKLREARRARVLTDAEVVAVVKAFDATGFGGYVRFLFLTAARRDEALGVRWADVDMARAVWTIPKEAEKTGETREELRRLPLSPEALAVLARQRERNMARGLGSSHFVFPSSPDGERLHRDAPKTIIYRLKGRRDNGTEVRPHKLAKPRPQLIPADFRLHDIRRSVADRMLNDLGLDAYVVDAGVLGHAKPGMLQTYAPNVPAKARGAVEAWGVELSRLLSETTVTKARARA